MYLYPTKKHGRCQYDAAENIDDKQKSTARTVSLQWSKRGASNVRTVLLQCTKCAISNSTECAIGNIRSVLLAIAQSVL